MVSNHLKLNRCLALAMLSICLVGFSACGNNTSTMQNGEVANVVIKPFPAEIDYQRPGDLPAKPGDFKINTKTNSCALVRLDPLVEAAIKAGDPDYPVRGFPFYTGILYDSAFKHPNAKGDERYGITNLGNYNLNIKQEVKSFVNDCQNDGTNLLITYDVGLNAAGGAYKITFTARQGNKFWSSSIERPEYFGKVEWVPHRFDYPEDKWNPDSDGMQLNNEFHEILLPGIRK